MKGFDKIGYFWTKPVYLSEGKIVVDDSDLPFDIR
jgi:hypothetical protein